MEELLINILGNSPTLIAVLLVHSRLDKALCLLDHRVTNLEKRKLKNV